jgi:multisubunit Na+/H+ antiporter MnhE subunit
MRPGIIKVPIDIKTDTGILLLNSLITMTPGTICLYLSDDNSYFYVHDMYITSKENSIKKNKRTRIQNHKTVLKMILIAAEISISIMIVAMVISLVRIIKGPFPPG